MNEEMLDKYRSMSDEELAQEAKSTWERINLIGCFGLKDILIYELLLRELERRGFAFTQTVDFYRIEDPAENDEFSGKVNDKLPRHSED